MAKDDGYVRFRCKMCGKRLKVREDKTGGGHVIPCPRCGELVTVPLVALDEDIQDAIEEAGRSKKVLEAFGTEEAVDRTKHRIEGFLRGGKVVTRENPKKAERQRERVEWHPTPKLAPQTTFSQLDSFWRKIKSLNEETYVRACNILTDGSLNTEKKREKMAGMRRYHLEKAHKIYVKCRRETLSEIDKGKADPAGDDKKSRELKGSLEALDLFAFYALSLEP